jgi:hypothetical protein
MSDETPTICRTGLAHKCALAPLLRPGKPGGAGPVASAGATAGRPAELLGELGLPRADRTGTAGRAARGAAAEEIAWRQALHAVELCQRVAELAARR